MIKLKRSQGLGDFLRVIKSSDLGPQSGPTSLQDHFPDIREFPLSSDLAQVRMSLIFLASLLKIMILLRGSVPCGLPELGAEGSVAKCHIIPAANDHSRDLGGGGRDPDRAFQPRGAPMRVCRL